MSRAWYGVLFCRILRGMVFKRVLHRIILLLVPTEANAYRPLLLEKRGLVVILFATLAVEILMVAQIVANTSFRDLFAAVLPASIEVFTNDERAALSLAPLRENELLRRAAQQKAEDMALKGYFSHQSPDGRAPWDFMKESGYDYLHAGENLAVHFYDSSDVVSAWMASPSHRANIVKPVYADIGIGIATGLYEGVRTTFVVQFFGTPKEARSAAPVSLAPLRADEAPQDPLEPAVAGEATSKGQPISALMRVLGSPRVVALSILSGFGALLIVGLLLAFVIKIQIQPLDLLGGGALVLAVIGGLLFLNGRIFVGELTLSQQAAATVTAVGPSPF